MSAQWYSTFSGLSPSGVLNDTLDFSFDCYVLLFIMFATQTYLLKSWLFSGSLMDNKLGENKLRVNPDFGKKLMSNPLDGH